MYRYFQTFSKKQNNLPKKRKADLKHDNYSKQILLITVIIKTNSIRYSSEATRKEKEPCVSRSNRKPCARTQVPSPARTHGLENPLFICHVTSV